MKITSATTLLQLSTELALRGLHASVELTAGREVEVTLSDRFGACAAASAPLLHEAIDQALRQYEARPRSKRPSSNPGIGVKS